MLIAAGLSRPRLCVFGATEGERIVFFSPRPSRWSSREGLCGAHPGGAAARFAAQEVRGERRRRRWRVRSLRTTRFRQCGKQWIFRAVALAHACVSTSSVFGVRGAVDRVTVVPIAVALFDCW